jgi:hypothetical protein
MELKLSGAQSGLLHHPLPFSLNFAVSARVRGSFSETELQVALEKLRQRHPLLAVRIAPTEDGACLTTEGVPEIPLKIFQRRTDLDWVAQVEREIAIPSDHLTGPLFRCIWVRGKGISDLVLVCDHITADGYAAVFALRDLLTLISEPNISLDPCLPSSMKDLIPVKMQEHIQKIASDPSRAQAEFPMPAGGTEPLNPLRVIPFEFDEDGTSTLVSACKTHQVTVQAALCAAFAVPFAERQPGSPVRMIESPMSIRGRLQNSVENIYGNYISLIYSKIDCTPGHSLWEIAHQAGQSLVSFTEEQLFSIPILMMGVLDQPLSGPVVHFDYDLSISNLGRIDIPANYGELSLESVYGPTMNISMPQHRILGVNTFAGRMRCTFTSRDPRAQGLVQRAREILAEMINHP